MNIPSNQNGRSPNVQKNILATDNAISNADTAFKLPDSVPTSDSRFATEGVVLVVSNAEFTNGSKTPNAMNMNIITKATFSWVTPRLF